MRTARQARQTAERASKGLPEVLRRFARLRQTLDAIGGALHPAVKASMDRQAADLESALLDMENVVGVVTPAALFGE